MVCSAAKFCGDGKGQYRWAWVADPLWYWGKAGVDPVAKWTDGWLEPGSVAQVRLAVETGFRVVCERCWPGGSQWVYAKGWCCGEDEGAGKGRCEGRRTA